MTNPVEPTVTLSVELMRGLLDSLPCEVFVTDDSDQVAYQNLASQIRFGRLSKGAPGQFFTEIFEDMGVAALAHRSCSACRESGYAPATEFRRGSQSFAIDYRRLDGAHVAWILQETTEQKGLEEKRHILSQLTAGVAHNFNNMLMIIEPCLEALGEVVPESHRDFVEDAAIAGQRSSEIVRQLMTVGGQRDPGSQAPFKFSSLCEQAVETCRKQYPNTLRLDFETHSDSEIVAAPQAMAQVLSTLLLNARNSVVRAGVRDPHIEATVQEVERGGQPWVELTVADNGPPLSEEVRSRIFEPFFSVRAGEGTGLELAMSEAIVRQHGGELTCNNSANVGTAFSLILPVTGNSGAKMESEMTSTPSEGIRVLVIDDEPAICRIVAHTLKRNGFVVESVSDPSLVEDSLVGEPFQVILLDRSMGGTKGSTLVPRIRQLGQGAKILYFTGEFVDSEEVAAVDGVVQKPVNSKQLTETLRKVL